MGHRYAGMEGLVSAWRGRCAYVTGATGLLGGWLVGELLQRGANVVALIRDDVPSSYLRSEGHERRCVTVRGSVEDLSLVRRVLAEYGVDTIFHLAAQTQVGAAHEAPYAALETNVRGTYTLLEAARLGTAQVRAVVVASSDKAYGEQASLPYTEEMPLLGSNLYDASKAAAEVLARAYARAYELPIVVARCANLFGGGDLNWARLIPGTIRAVLQGKRPVIRSDGLMIRDYLYVRDAAMAFVRLAEEASTVTGEAFNFGLERPLTVLEVVEKIGEVTGTRIDPEIRSEARGEIQRQYLSAARARERFGWRPLVGLEDGLRETVAWYRSYFGRGA